MEMGARNVRAEGLAKVAGGAAKASARGAAPLAQALSVGYLPGSAGLLEYASRGQAWPQLVSQMRWAGWQPSFALPIFDSRVDISIGTLKLAQVHAPSTLLSLEVVAHFAIDQAPNFAPFNAWSYKAARGGKAAMRTAPLAFEAAMPDRVGLQINYAVEAAQSISRLASGGTVYLPVGARDGATTGIYVLASPSRITGALPDFTEYTFSGDLVQPMRRNTGGTPDFDFVTLTISPVTA
jgi:hypothetical protein